MFLGHNPDNTLPQDGKNLSQLLFYVVDIILELKCEEKKFFFTHLTGINTNYKICPFYKNEGKFYLNYLNQRNLLKKINK